MLQNKGHMHPLKCNWHLWHVKWTKNQKKRVLEPFTLYAMLAHWWKKHWPTNINIQRPLWLVEEPSPLGIDCDKSHL